MGNKTNLSNLIRAFLLRYKVIIAFGALALLIYFLDLWMLKHYDFVYDSGGYWFMRTLFIPHSKFRITNFDNPVRSYLFPLILFVVSRIGRAFLDDQLRFLIICEAIVYSFFLTILIPKLVQTLIGRSLSYVYVWVFSLLAVYFWRGYFYYPLTDIPALIFSCLAVYFSLRYYRAWWGGFVIGIFLGASAVIRPSYQIIVIPFIWWLIIFYSCEARLTVKRTVIQTVIVMIGVISVYIPQIMINSSNFGTYSPFVQTQRVQGTDLFTQQLIWGITVQKYETNIGDSYPIPGVVFFDGQGEKILTDLGLQNLIYVPIDEVIHADPIPLKLYLDIVLKYPIEFVWIYARHLFNGLDLRFDTPYLTDVFASSYFRQLLNYSIWFLAINFVITDFKRIKRSWVKITPIFLLCLPSVLSIPTAIETRFMLPLHVLCYILVAFFVLPEVLRWTVQDIKRRVIEGLPSYAIFVVICFLLSSSTYMGLEHLILR